MNDRGYGGGIKQRDFLTKACRCACGRKHKNFGRTSATIGVHFFRPKLCLRLLISANTFLTVGLPNYESEKKKYTPPVVPVGGKIAPPFPLELFERRYADIIPGEWDGRKKGSSSSRMR